MDHSDYSSTAVDGLTSLRYHYFGNSWSSFSPEELKSRVSVLDQAGYYSVLLPYHNHLNDNFIIAARALDKSEAIKYNIAIRSGSVSAEYCGMQVASFHMIDRDRLILNVLHGSPEAIEQSDFLLEDRNLAKKTTQDFVNFKKHKTEIVIPGASDETLDMVGDYADYCAIDYDSFRRELNPADEARRKLNKYLSSKRLMVTVDIAVVYNEKEKQKVADMNQSNKSLICGNDLEIVQHLEFLRSKGVNDILIANAMGSPSEHRTHELIKNLS
jgi:hypothetical protein